VILSRWRHCRGTVQN